MRLLDRPVLFNRTRFQNVLRFLAAAGAALGLSLLGACHHHHPGAAPQEAAITSFTAADLSIAQGASTTLTAVFTGVSARVDPLIGAVASGVPMSTGTMTAAKTFTLTVTGDRGTTATRTVQVLVTLQHHLAGNAGVAGAVLAYTDGTAKTATADETGLYSLDVPDDWSGTVTPSLMGYAFTPPNRVYAHVLADLTAQDFTAAAGTITISGNAGVAGASLAYMDGTPRTATADGAGAYSFTVSSNWSGSVTPSKTGYTFSPASTPYTNLLANQAAQNYTATAIITYTISGNAGVAGASLAYTDGTPKAATADGAGAYSFSVSSSWSGTVTPSKTGYSFSPASTPYTSVLANQTAQNYAATAGTITISGNAGLAGAFLWDTDSTKIVATADASGNYTLALPYNWSGTVTPGATSYAFTPASRTYASVQASLPAENYTATVTHIIMGTTQVAGTTLAYTVGVALTTTADANGLYYLFVPEHWSGTVTPSKSGYTFTPANRSYTDLQADLFTEGFVPMGITYTVAGNAGAAGATLAYTDGTAKTATADSSGAYSFTVSYNWSGPVAPSLLGHAFTPVSRSFTKVLANQTGQDFVANTGSTHTVWGNAGLAGATLAYTDGTAQTATADGSGNYSFNVSYNWSGTVLPGSALRQVFAPASRSYAYVLSDQPAQDYTPIPGIFTATPNANLTSPRYGHTSTLLANGKTLVAGGEGNANLVNTKLYNPTIGTFAPTRDTHGNLTSCVPRYEHTATVLLDSKVLLAGGWRDYSGPQDAEIYDPATGLFTATVGPMVTARYEHSATLLPDGKVLIAGGNNYVSYTNGGFSGTALATAELYDPSTGRFTATGNLIGQRNYPTANLLPNGRVLLAGGSSYGASTVLGTAELYDPATGLFAATGSLLMPREYHTSTLLPSGKVLFVGGQNILAVANSELYDPATGVFTASGPMGAMRRLHTATLLANGKVLVAGGDISFNALDSAELYDPGTGSFSPTGSMVVKREQHSASALPGGQVLLTGTYGPDESAEVFDPQDPAPGLPWFAYTPAVFHFTKDTAITAIAPQSTGATAWTITPALPLGLGFSANTGAITGQPTALAAAQAYLVTASNGANQSSDFIWVSVAP